MKKLHLLPILLMLLSASVFGQKAAESSEKTPLGSTGNAIVIDLEADPKNVEDVMDKKFKKLKSKKEKGFVFHEAAEFPEISASTIDIYWTVEKSKGDNSRIIVFLSKGYDNWMSSQTNPAEVQNAIKFLNTMVTEVRKHELNIAIDAQTKVLEGATKDFEKLVKEGEDLKKDQQKLEEELAENKEDQETNKQEQEEQKNVVSEEKKVLEELQKKLGQVK